MPYLVGSLVRLSTRVEIDDDVLVDPTTITLTVQAPDETLTTPTPVKDDTGQYHADITPAQAGIYAYRWATTGVGQGVEEGTFLVTPSVIGTSPALINLTPETLATYLDLDEEELDIDRATLMLWQAQALAESIVTPIPAAGVVVVLAAAARAYANVLGSAQQSMGGFSASLPQGSVFLTAAEKTQLKQFAGRGGASTFSMIPADYELSVPVWDRTCLTDTAWDNER